MIARRFSLLRTAALWLLASCILPLGGCTQIHAPTSPSAPPDTRLPPMAPPVSNPSIKPQMPAAKPFSPDTLYSLLTAELAGSREYYELALDNYLQQSRETRDPQIAERATLIARFLNQPQHTLEAAQIWLEASPDNQDALSNAAYAHLQLGQLQESFRLSIHLQNLGGEPLFQGIALGAQQLDNEARTALLRQFEARLAQQPRNEQLLIGCALLHQQQRDFAAAMTLTQDALKLHPRSFTAAALEANLLYQLGQTQAALTKTAQLLETYPHNLALRKEYARMLLHTDLALAQEQFERLVEQAPGDGDLRLALGIIALEREDQARAQAAFEELLNRDQHLSTAHYYLGRIAEAQADPSTATLHYLQVEQGRDFLSATRNLLDIFIRQGDLLSAQQQLTRMRNHAPTQSEALYLLHADLLRKYKHGAAAEYSLKEALNAHPLSTHLRFSRAMLYYERASFSAAEEDLRLILRQEPDHLLALNSLGYLLADQTQRFDEARGLLEQALSLAPSDPAILDSMGWLLYRTGAQSDALNYLQRAFNGQPNAEISAHLGELLWVLGKPDEARQIWQEGLKLNPHDPTLKSTLKRFKVEP